MITAEEIYRIFHRETMLIKLGFYPKRIKNIKKDDNWIFFEKCANMIENSSGQINTKKYIKILAEHYEGWFQPKFLCSLKSIKIYKNQIAIENLSSDLEEIYNLIKKSIKFIAEYCIINGINNIDGYIYENKYTLPTLAKHFNSGVISEYFLNIIPKGLLKSIYPNDIYEEFFGKYTDNYDRRHKILLKDIRIRKIMDLYPEIINQIIDNKRHNIKK